MLRYEAIKDMPNRVLDLTSLTVEEFEELVGPFETAYVRHMQAWTMEGKPRTGRRYSQYVTCPLPTPEDRLLFILSYLKVAALQVAHGTMFAMSQSNANKWIQLLLLVLHQTLQDLGDLPARYLQALHAHLTTLRDPESSDSPPLFITMALNDRSSVPKIRTSKRRIIAARKSITA